MKEALLGGTPLRVVEDGQWLGHRDFSALTGPRSSVHLL
jgi:hypothetical protein